MMITTTFGESLIKTHTPPPPAAHIPVMQHPARFRTLRRGFVIALLATVIAMISAGFIQNADAAAPPAVNQCNGVDNPGGLETACTVTVVNNLDLASGVTSSTLTIADCHGAANTTPTCIESTTSYTLDLSGAGHCGAASSRRTVAWIDGHWEHRQSDGRV
jgi:hypothetical protein